MRPPTLALLALVVPAAVLAQSDVESVRVVNLPEIQQVDGTVRIGEPAPHTRLLTVKEAIVSPAGVAETTAFTSAGVVETAGFASAVLSLAGQVKSDYFGSGVVGAVLVPDTTVGRAAFEEEQELLFPLRVEAAVEPGGPAYFQSDQPQVRLAFPRYRVYFYNSTDRPAGV